MNIISIGRNYEFTFGERKGDPDVPRKEGFKNIYHGLDRAKVFLLARSKFPTFGNIDELILYPEEGDLSPDYARTIYKCAMFAAEFYPSIWSLSSDLAKSEQIESVKNFLLQVKEKGGILNVDRKTLPPERLSNRTSL